MARQQQQALTRPFGLLATVLVALVATVIARGPAPSADAPDVAAPEAAPDVVLGGVMDIEPLLHLASGASVRGTGGLGRGWIAPQRRAASSLSPAMIDACLEVARDIGGDIAQQLTELRKSKPEVFERVIRQSNRLVALAELKRRDPSMYDLKLFELRNDAQVSRLAAAWREARREGRTADAETLESDLKMAVILQLGLRHNSRADYLCRIRERVERLEHELQHERDHFDEVLDRRLQELAGSH